MGKIYAVYFSPTGNVKKMVMTATKKWVSLAGETEPVETIDYCAPDKRGKVYRLDKEDLLIIGFPTYAGRLPNKLLADLKEGFVGNNTPAICLVSFGNRSQDEALRELVLLCEARGFICIGAMACVGEHAFSDKLAPGRPDGEDLDEIRGYTGRVYETKRPVALDRNSPIGPYYTPLKEDLSPARFLKAKPKTREELCSHCGRCVSVCPLASIQADCVSVEGVCIKCQACIKVCEKKAKYFDDPDFLSHVAMLEKNHTDRKENAFYKFIK